jgi:hypothetical protein
MTDLDNSLPTAEELKRLTMRAVVAYTARTARRLSSAFRGLVPDQVVDDALRYLEHVAVANSVHDINQAEIIHAAERLVAAYEAAPDNVKSIKKFYIVFSFVQAAVAATHAVEAFQHPEKAEYEMRQLVSAAEHAIRPIRALEESAAASATEAARNDYAVLIKLYGSHDKVEFGEAIDCFDRNENGGTKRERKRDRSDIDRIGK